MSICLRVCPDRKLTGSIGVHIVFLVDRRRVDIFSIVKRTAAVKSQLVPLAIRLFRRLDSVSKHNLG